MKQKLLATLLHYANSNPPCFADDFYNLKKKLLHKYGTFKGHLIQEISKECYGYWDHNWGEYKGCIGAECLKCGGTGLFEARYHRLQKWDWAGFSFLIPDSSTSIKPDRIDIVGRVEHEVKNTRMAREAHFWLYLLTGEWGMFFGEFRGGYHVYCGFWPMLNMQRAWAKIYCPYKDLRRHFKRCECHQCGKKYFRRNGRSFVCKKCADAWSLDETPF